MTHKGEGVKLVTCRYGHDAREFGTKCRTCVKLERRRWRKRHPGNRRDKPRTPERTAWVSMLGRCYRQNAASYKSYGGRGITVCERWRSSFANFLADMGRRPSPEYSIDRKDNNGNYEPSNCRWATRLEQGCNRRNNIMLEFRGERLSVSEWSRRVGLTKAAIISRVRQLGWTVERALTTPARARKRKKEAMPTV